MKKQLYLNAKIIMISLGVVGIMFSASTIIPSIQGANTIETIEQIKNDYIISDQNINQIELLMNIFDIIKNKQDEKTIKECRLTSLNDNIMSSDDFEDYWFYYKAAIKSWNSSFTEWQADNFEEWWDKAYQYIYGEGTNKGDIVNFLTRSRLAKNNMMIFGITMLVSSAFIPTNPNAFITIFWLTLAVLFGYNFSILFMYYTGVARFVLQLEWRQIDILVHVIDEEGNGVAGLESYYNEYGVLEGYISAHNIDAYDALETEPIVSKEQFTYYLGPAMNSKDPGWYSLSTWNHEDLINPYVRAPLAPGRWSISIMDYPEEIVGYKTISYDTQSIGTHERCVLTLQLEKE